MLNNWKILTISCWRKSKFPVSDSNSGFIIQTIISEENLNEAETRKFLEDSFRNGEIKTTGTDIDKIMPPVTRFGGARAKKKQTVIEKLKAFFERFFGIGSGSMSAPASSQIDEDPTPMVAEEEKKYGE